MVSKKLLYAVADSFLQRNLENLKIICITNTKNKTRQLHCSIPLLLCPHKVFTEVSACNSMDAGIFHSLPLLPQNFHVIRRNFGRNTTI
jgi:hypothetical protein